MALAVVKATKLSSGSGNNCSGAVSATAGNALLVGGSAYIASSTSSTFSVARTGDTYTTDTSGVTAGTVDNTSTGVASAPNVAGGSVTMTVTATNGNGVIGFALEVSGTPTASIRDAISPAIAQGTGTTATTNALTNVTADAIYVAMMTDKQSAAGGTVTAGAGWTQSVSPTTMTETDGSSFPVCGMAYQIVASAASRTASWTINNVAWAAGIAVYKAAAGGGPTTYNQTFTGGLTSSGGITRASAHPVSGALADSGVLRRTIAHALAGALTDAGAITRRTATSVAGQLTNSGALVAGAGRVFAGALTSSGQIAARGVAHGISGALTFAGVVLRTTIRPAFTGALTSAGAITLIQAANVFLGGAIGSAGATLRTVAHGLAGSLRPVGNIPGLGGAVQRLLTLLGVGA